MLPFTIVNDKININELRNPQVSIGNQAGAINQGNYAIAIGNKAGQTNQSINTIAIGNEAGNINQGSYSIAIGNKAGQTNQPNNSIIINADSSGISTAIQPNSLYINPIRNLSQTNVLGYDSINKEITYFTLSTSSLNVANQIALTSDISSGNYYIPFSKTNSVTANDLYINSLTYNPSTNNLSASTFTGNLVGNANTSTNLANGTTGQIPYQSGAGTTSFLSTGTSGQILQSNGASAPTWIGQSTLSVGSSTTSVTSTNLANGTTGQIPYQTAPNSTSFLSTGTSGQILQSNGASVPTWVNQSTISGVINNITQSSPTISYSDSTNTNLARFIMNTGSSVTLSTNQKVLITATGQYMITSGAQNIAFTIGRGTSSTPSTSYINLPNNVVFSTTDIAVSNTVATVDNFNTSLTSNWYPNANESANFIMTFLDQPGTGTFYYAIRIINILSSSVRIRNCYFIFTIVN